MGKKKAKSETLDNSETKTFKFESGSSLDSALAETPKPKPAPTPKFNGPTITLKDIDVKGGGIISVTCLDDKVPLGKIQIIEIKAGNSRYVYRRI